MSFQAYLDNIKAKTGKSRRFSRPREESRHSHARPHGVRACGLAQEGVGTTKKRDPD
jgi:hypothetical protein